VAGRARAPLDALQLASAGPWISRPQPMRLRAGDFVQVVIRQNSGSNTTVFKDEDLTREFSMTWLGARAVARSIAARRSSTRC
jgi:hypothetical protein